MSWNIEQIILVLLTLAAAVWLWRRAAPLTGRGRAADGAGSRLTFTSERPASELLAEIESALGLPAGARSRIFGRTYVARTGERHLALASGTRLRTSFTSSLVLHDSPSGGTSGSYQVTTWSQGFRAVRGVDQMRSVERRVLEILRDLDAPVVAVPLPNTVAAAPTASLALAG